MTTTHDFCIRVSESLKAWCTERDLRYAESGPRSCQSQGEDIEGTVKGPWTPQQRRPHRSPPLLSALGVLMAGLPNAAFPDFHIRPVDLIAHLLFIFLPTRVIMLPTPKYWCYMREEGLQSQSEAQGHLGGQIPETKAEESSTSSSSSCSCSSSSYASSSSSSSSSFSPLSSSHCQITGIMKVHADPAKAPHPLQLPQSGYFSPTVMAVTPSIRSCKGFSTQEEEGPSISQALLDTGPLLRDAIEDKVAGLVGFLLLKYRTKEPITKAEMLSSVIKEYQDHFFVIFNEASECMQLVFGIDVKEVDPTSHSYVLVTTLGLTCNGMLNDEQSVPKTGLLINILGVIFMNGNCAPEGVIWEVLSVMGVYDGREHFIYGEPRKLITKDWVQEQYLEYRQVPNSNPACYEFLWGPRAHAETSKMKVLELLAEVNDTIPMAFPNCYEEALKDEKERSQARAVVSESGAARTRVWAYSRATSSSFSCSK
ncbi:PREDICTED: melanoma-associated antigen 10-like [Miniopterus natalensis]|uniref:melanoma-associated antigen 10-like n=1 Tax=Miniopterus natalensis TaxID=291302 RepID=UPI0007A6DB3F|nr:PREDICTED: melanoma-associated antigen 10-like [Miniopterus natalensis]